VSGGVTRPKVCGILQVLHPARAAVSRHPRKAAATLSVILGQRSTILKCITEK